MGQDGRRREVAGRRSTLWPGISAAMRALVLLAATLPSASPSPTPPHPRLGDEDAGRLRRLFGLLDRDHDGSLSATEAVIGLGVGLDGQSAAQLCAQAAKWRERERPPCGPTYSRADADGVDYGACLKSWGSDLLARRGGWCDGGPAPPEGLGFAASLATFARGLPATGAALSDVAAVGGVGAEAGTAAPPVARRATAAAAAPPPADTNDTATILLSSDWHIEPWFSGDAWNHTQPWWYDGVVRFAHPSNLNMMRCADGATGLRELPCLHAKKSDPPLDHAVSHFEAFEAIPREPSSAPPSLVSSATLRLITTTPLFSDPRPLPRAVLHRRHAGAPHELHRVRLQAALAVPALRVELHAAVPDVLRDQDAHAASDDRGHATLRAG